jgi:hypothetical protein
MDTKVKSSTKVRYKYIPRRVHGVMNKNHVLYEGKLDSAIDKFSILRDRSGGFKLNLSEKDLKFVQDGLGLTDQEINVHNRKNTYLESILIEMPKRGLFLDISKPYDFLIDKVLQAYDNVVAPNNRRVKEKASYRYVRLKDDEEVTYILETSDLKKKAYKLLGALEGSKERMLLYLTNTGMRLNTSVTVPVLRKLVNEAVDKNQKKFVDTLEDKLFTEKGIIRLGAILKVIQVKSSMYYYQEAALAFEGKAATLENASVYLSDTEQADLRLAISEKIIDAFKGVK